jgi:hypothetical protein
MYVNIVRRGRLIFLVCTFYMKKGIIYNTFNAYLVFDLSTFFQKYKCLSELDLPHPKKVAIKKR